MSEENNKGPGPWLTLILTVMMLCLSPLFSAQVTCVCETIFHVMGVSGEGIMLGCLLY